MKWALKDLICRLFGHQRRTHVQWIAGQECTATQCGRCMR